MRWHWAWFVIGVPFAGVVGYAVFLFSLTGWQVHQVEQLCKEMRPGTPVASIRPAIVKRHLWNSLVAYQFDHDGGKGSYTELTKTWDYGVPALMTLGDTECFISHDGSVVVSTQVMY